GSACVLEKFASAVGADAVAHRDGVFAPVVQHGIAPGAHDSESSHHASGCWSNRYTAEPARKTAPNREKSRRTRKKVAIWRRFPYPGIPAFVRPPPGNVARLESVPSLAILSP